MSESSVSYRTTGMLYSISTYEGKEKFQITLSPEASEELVKRGFKDMETVSLTIEKLKPEPGVKS